VEQWRDGEIACQQITKCIGRSASSFLYENQTMSTELLSRLLGASPTVGRFQKVIMSFALRRFPHEAVLLYTRVVTGQCVHVEF
jgi:hypothetical protein